MRLVDQRDAEGGGMSRDEKLVLLVAALALLVVGVWAVAQ